MPVVVFNRAWQYEYINAAAERALKRSASSLVGRVVWDVYPETTHTAIGRTMRDVMSSRVAGRISEPADDQPDMLVTAALLPMDGGRLKVLFTYEATALSRSG